MEKKKWGRGDDQKQTETICCKHVSQDQHEPI